MQRAIAMLLVSSLLLVSAAAAGQLSTVSSNMCMTGACSDLSGSASALWLRHCNRDERGKFQYHCCLLQLQGHSAFLLCTLVCSEGRDMAHRVLQA